MQTEQRLWVEKYRPMKFDTATTMHKDQIDMLQKLAKSDDFPHILLYGPSGSGKRSLIKCLLQELYQTNAVHKIKSELKEFKAGASGSTSVECIVFSSNYHIEVTPCEADNHDKVIIQKLIKEIAGSQQLDQK
jgi:replication factor C subunit 3/5|tara:strand:- start:793 stop:1191 length:399 start_codon:yes stop_codon:yes gene_type:complete